MPNFENAATEEVPEEQSEKGASEQISQFIEEEIERLDKEESEKEAASVERNKRMRSEGSAVIQHTANEIVRETLDAQIENAMLMADVPEAARSILMDEAIERIRKTLMTPEDIAKAQSDERIAQLLGLIEGSVTKEAKNAMISALSEKMDNATDPAEISKYNKLIEAIEGEK